MELVEGFNLSELIRIKNEKQASFHEE